MPRRDLLTAGLLAAVLAVILVPFARTGVDPHHDGIMLKPALDVLSGQTLFRDTFMQYGALSCYLQVVALWFQPTLLCLKLTTAAAYVATLLLLYATWRLLLPRSLTLLSCGLFILFLPSYEKNYFGDYWVLLPWSSVLALMLQCLGLYALLQVIRHESAQRWCLILGMAGAGAFWCRQPVGVFLIGSLVVIALGLHWTGWRPAHHSKRSLVFWTSAGLAGVSVLLLGTIFFSGAAPEWWYQNFVWPGKWATSSATVTWRIVIKIFLHPASGAVLLGVGLGAVIPGLLRRFRPSFPVRGILLYYVFLAAVLVWRKEQMLAAFTLRDGGWSLVFPLVVLLQSVASLAGALAARRQPPPAEYHLIAAFAALSLGSLVQYYPVPDPWHIFWSLAPAFGLCVYAFWRWTGWSAPVVAGVIGLTLLPSLYAKIRLAGDFLTQPLVTLSAPSALRGLRLPPNQAEAYNRIVRTLDPILRDQPDIPTIMTGNDALYLCFANNRVNPSPYFVTWPDLLDPASTQKRWNFVGRFRPLMFLQQANWTAVADFYRRARYVPLAYLPDLALEIAVPQELAERLGLPVYDGALGGAAAPAFPPR